MSWLEVILHAFGVGTSHGLTQTHMTHHDLDSGEATTFPLIVFSAALCQGYSKWLFFPRLPSWSLETILVGVPGLWELISPDCQVRLKRGLNQCCSSLQELSNAMSHTVIGRRKEVDSRLLVVGSQTASLTPGPSFARNLVCRCPNGQCEVSLDIYTSRPFQWHQEHPNSRCFGPSTRALSFWESRRTPSSHFWECGLRPHT
jgi:hypothetical protein